MREIRKLFFIFSLLFLLIAASGSAAREAKKVAVFPFQINAAQNLDYLKEGILDMLGSRLAWEGEVEVIEKQVVKEAMVGRQGVVNEAAAQAVGKKLGADYVLFGSLTVFGDSVSIDAKMLGLTEEKPPVAVYAQTKGMDEVIPRINQFAQDINNKIFGRSPTVVAAKPQQQFSQAHPERIMSQPMVAPAGPQPVPQTVPQQDGATSFIRVRPDTPEGGSPDLWNSQKLDFPVNSMDTGDIDGDGRPEIVVLANFRKVMVYQWDRGRLLKRGTFEGGTSERFVWVCLWDANYDGRAEIYVSNVRNDILSSYVLGWEGGGKLVELGSKQRWYFNRVSLPGKGEVLVGQHKTPKALFEPGVFQLQCANGDCKPLEAISVPKEANVFNFAQADLTGDGRVETALIGFGDKLYLKDEMGQQIWKSRDYFGATANLIPGPKALETREMTRGATNEDEVERYYIPSQLLVVDFNNDQRVELLANRNVSFAARLLTTYRNFSDAQIQSMVWQQFELVPQWKTRPLRGMVVSYRLSDVDGDGRQELVAAVALDKQMIKASKSMLFVYELDQVLQSGPTETTPPPSS